MPMGLTFPPEARHPGCTREDPSFPPAFLHRTFYALQTLFAKTFPQPCPGDLRAAANVFGKVRTG